MEDFQANVLEVSEFEGEIPREELHKYHWSPTEGALLASGIRVKGLWPKFDYATLAVFGISGWRINYCQHILARWGQEYDLDRPVQPEFFLSWLKMNPVPPLDFSGKEIKSEARVVDFHGKVAGQVASLLEEGEGPRKKTRTSDLQEYIDKAIKEAGSDSPVEVFNVIRDWCMNDVSPFKALSGKQFVYTSSTNKTKSINQKKIASALSRRKQKKGL